MHYQFLENDDFSFSLTGGFRNYGYHYVDEPGKDTANMQRWKIAPDWDVKLTDDLRFNGWLSMYKFANDLRTRPVTLIPESKRKQACNIPSTKRLPCE